MFGASNVTLGLPTVVGLIRSGFSGPLHIDIADGHGRSYGIDTTVLMRGLPGHTMRPIPSSSETDSVSAMLTDIGNDLVYGVPVQQTADWVSQLAGQLVLAKAELVMTELPLASVRKLSKARFAIFRSLFFPGSGMGLAEIKEKSEELNELVREIAASMGATLIAPDGGWYGLDPIHIRRRQRAAAWQRIMEGWSDWHPGQPPSASLRESFRLWRSRSQEVRWFGKIRKHADVVTPAPETTLRFF